MPPLIEHLGEFNQHGMISLPCSEPTKVESRQRQRWISSRLTSWSACSIKSASTRNGYGWSFSSRPALRSSPDAGSSSNASKRNLVDVGKGTPLLDTLVEC